MHYRSLLFSGVFITAIASLLIVQSCTKHDQAGNERNRVGNESDQSGNERDRAGTESDLELVAASTQAQSYLQGLLATGQKIKQRGYYTTTEKLDNDQYLQDKLIIKNWCVSKNNRDACSILKSLRESEGTIENLLQMHDLIGK
jgi:chromosomal replication initiation ATPase DnaA